MNPKLHSHQAPGKGLTVPARYKKTLHVLNDLVRINIDRITGYEKAAHQDKTKDPDLRDLFYKMATESRSYVNDLHAEIIRMGGAPVTQSTITGKIYLHWLDGKNMYDGEDNSRLFSECMKSEEGIQRSYHQALQEGLPENLQQLAESQLWALERAQQRLQQTNQVKQHDDQYDRLTGM